MFNVYISNQISMIANLYRRIHPASANISNFASNDLMVFLISLSFFSTSFASSSTAARSGHSSARVHLLLVQLQMPSLVSALLSFGRIHMQYCYPERASSLLPNLCHSFSFKKFLTVLVASLNKNLRGIYRRSVLSLYFYGT